MTSRFPTLESLESLYRRWDLNFHASNSPPGGICRKLLLRAFDYADEITNEIQTTITKKMIQ